MRVVSLLPAATEIVAALGRIDWLVGVSHECDCPPEVKGKPRVSRCEICGKGLPSIRITWEQVLQAQPEMLVPACCGYDAERTVQDLEFLKRQPGWNTLPAASSRQVYAVDGNAYFSRPGPRIVDSLEMLAEMVHPELFPTRSPAWILAAQAVAAWFSRFCQDCRAGAFDVGSSLYRG